MAEQLKLVWRDELKSIQTGTETDLGSIDLQPWLARDGYKPAASTDGSPVDDVIALNPSGTSNDNLASNMQGLDGHLSRVADLKEYDNYQSVWIRRQMPSETYARQAYIYEIQRPDQIDEAGLFRSQSYLPEYQIGLKRAGWWENPTFKNYATASPISALGGKLTYTGLGGDRPARIGRLQLSSSYDLLEFWVGVQTDRLGFTPANFNPVWNLHKGLVSVTYDASIVEDATAQDGSKIVVTFATHPEMQQRVTMTADESGAAGTYQQGRYSILLRANCTNTLVARVRLGNGFRTDEVPAGQFSTFWRHEISGAAWKLYTLDEVNFPSRPTYGERSGMAYSALQIEAEKVSGSGNLELDILGLVPTLDGMIYVKGINVANGLIYDLYQRPAGEVFGKVIANSAPNIITHEELHPAPRNYGLRPAAGDLVCFAQRSAGSTKADTLSLSLDVIERWVTLRGAAGAHP